IVARGAKVAHLAFWSALNVASGSIRSHRPDHHGEYGRHDTIEERPSGTGRGEARRPRELESSRRTGTSQLLNRPQVNVRAADGRLALRLPVAHVEPVRHDPRARFQLTHQLRLQSQVD